MNATDHIDRTLKELNKNYGCGCGPIKAIMIPGDISAAIYDRKRKLGIIIIGEDAACDDLDLMRLLVIHEYAHIGTEEIRRGFKEWLSKVLTGGHDKLWRDNEQLLLADYDMEVDFLPLVTYERGLRVNGVSLGNPYAIHPKLSKKHKMYEAINMGILAMIPVTAGAEVFFPEARWFQLAVFSFFTSSVIVSAVNNQLRNRRIMRFVRSKGYMPKVKRWS